MRSWRTYRDSEDGAVTIEMTFMVVLMSLLTIGAVEMGWAYHQYSSAQSAARHGARLAATLDPVSAQLTQRSLSQQSFDITCTAEPGQCSAGAYQSQAMNHIIYGPDGRLECGGVSGSRRGMCDLYPKLDPANVSVRYISTGFASNNASGNPTPLVTVTITERPFRTVLIGQLLPDRFTRLPAISATLMGEDLNG